MAERVRIAIVGSGPGGLTAAAHAASKGISHLLLEAEAHFSNTIVRYQKGKHVMAQPEVLPLHGECPLEFEAGTRERILETWNTGAEAAGVKVKFASKVDLISGAKGDFTLTLANKQTVAAEHVVLGVGTAGNPRTLGVPGDDHPRIQYTLDDPEEYYGETIFVVGAGDAAIENAIGLAKAENTVIIVNRRDEFSRAKEGNLNAVLRAIEDGTLECMYETNANRVEAPEGGVDGKPMQFVLDTPDGEVAVPCDRIIARLGGIPPRGFLEKCGVELPNDSPSAVPALSSQYESNVPGLYIIGALAGYPLIKQCMNQGYEVVEYIEGNRVEPADEPLLKEKFRAFLDLPVANLEQAAEQGMTVLAKPRRVATVDKALELIQQSIPLFAGLTTLQLREFMIDSRMIAPNRGDVIFKRNEFTDTFFSILRGTVTIQIPQDEEATRDVPIGWGGFFGEMSLIAGRPRTATAVAGGNCVLIETPRRSMVKLINSVESVKRIIDEAFITRAIQHHIAPEAGYQGLAPLVKTATTQHFKPGEVLFKEGEPGDCLHLIRSGSVAISREESGKQIILSYMPSGHYLGEIALVNNRPRTATATAAVATETVRVDGEAFQRLMNESPLTRERVLREMEARLSRESSQGDDASAAIGGAISEGLVEATNVLIIDDSLCVRCDFCEKACAETHNGTSRLDREAGPSIGQLHVPTSCRHCEHPHCMKDCPPDAIHRGKHGEVFIDEETCIGCGNCQQNCPYGVIQMAVVQPRKSNLWRWLLTGAGVMPGTDSRRLAKAEGIKKAVKCDLCKDLAGEAACVRACPTGAALRIGHEKLAEMLH